MFDDCWMLDCYYNHPVKVYKAHTKKSDDDIFIIIIMI